MNIPDIRLRLSTLIRLMPYLFLPTYLPTYLTYLFLQLLYCCWMLSNVLTLAEFHQKLHVVRPYHNCLNEIQLVQFQAQSLYFSFISGDTFFICAFFFMDVRCKLIRGRFFLMGGRRTCWWEKGKNEDLWICWVLSKIFGRRCSNNIK